MQEDDNCFKKEDREELLKQGWQLDVIQISLADMKDAAQKTSDRAITAAMNLEGRVRSLENFKWVIWGAGSIIAILIGWLVTLLANVVPHK